MKLSGLISSNIAFVARGGIYLPSGHIPPAGHDIPADFAGICVASSPDPACDDYIIDRLREIGIRHVRLDFTYGGGERHTARFLDRLLDESIGVLLHLVQPLDEARRIESSEAQERWRGFVGDTLDRWGDRIEAVEIGSTVNRRKWSGYTISGFSIAWRIAHDEARNSGVNLAGPNVTDFEVFYNVALLGQMRADGTLPDTHTTNLFAERTIEPEAWDRRVLGRLAAPLIKFNLIKKARLLQKIGRVNGAPEFWSTHAAWSKRRIRRILPNIEQKQADYLARYLVLVAASGAMSRVYWGPMIGQREGIIDDGTEDYPESIPHVTLYELARGDVGAYRIRPGLHALTEFTRLIPGTRYEGRAESRHGLEAHAFSRDGSVIHALWTTNGHGAELATLYDDGAELQAAEWTDRDGRPMDAPPPLVTESPCYARWRVGEAPRFQSGSGPIRRLVVHKPMTLYKDAEWRGAVDAGSDDERAALLGVIAPNRLEQAERRKTLRDARNTVWTIADPKDTNASLVVKRARLTKWHKRIVDRWKPAKARRSWNGACELTRRGIETPRPIAWFERTQRAALRESYYICEFAPGDLSVRTFFTAYASGSDRYGGVQATEFYDQLCAFLLIMHRRGVYFRDLSAGNILVTKRDDGALGFSLIDTGRGRFYNHKVTVRQRLSDLKRVCHPLHWAGRETFVGMYMAAIGEPFGPAQQLPFRLYDLKHRLKRPLKRLRKGKNPFARRNPAAGGAR